MAKGGTVATLTTDLVTNTASFDKGLGHARGELNKFGKDIAGMNAKLNSALSVGATVGALQGLRGAADLATGVMRALRGDTEGMWTVVERLPLGVGGIIRSFRDLANEISGAAEQTRNLAEHQRQYAALVSARDGLNAMNMAAGHAIKLLQAGAERKKQLEIELALEMDLLKIKQMQAKGNISDQDAAESVRIAKLLAAQKTQNLEAAGVAEEDAKAAAAQQERDAIQVQAWQKFAGIRKEIDTIRYGARAVMESELRQTGVEEGAIKSLLKSYDELESVKKAAAEEDKRKGDAVRAEAESRQAREKAMQDARAALSDNIRVALSVNQQNPGAFTAASSGREAMAAVRQADKMDQQTRFLRDSLKVLERIEQLQLKQSFGLA
jgi:hypothetical protein